MVRKSLPARADGSAVGDGGGAAWRIALLYGAQFLAIGMMMPLLPVWLTARGLDSETIGRVLAAQGLARVAAQPALAHLADVSGRVKAVMLACVSFSLLAFLGLSVIREVWFVFAGVVLAAFFFSPLVPLTETLAAHCGARLGVAYGRLRLWGSAAFIGGALAAGLVLDALAPGRLIRALVAGQGLVLLAVLAQPPWRLEGHAAAREARGGDERWRFALNGSFLAFLLAAGLVQASHALLYGFAAIHWKAAGHSGVVIGALVATGVVAEIALFWFSARVEARLGALQLLQLAALAGVVRWAGMAFDPPLAVLFGLQALHGLTFGAAHLGAIAFIRSRMPARMAATGQALYSALAMGLFMTAAMWASGRLYAVFGAGGWWAMAAMCALALPTAALARVFSRPRAPAVEDA